MTRISVAAIAVLLFTATPAFAQPETRGSHTFTTWDAGHITLAGASIPVMVYYPTDAGGPFPVVAVVHGASRNMSYMAEMARTFASRGFVAVTPSIPCTVFGCDHAANARQVRALLDWTVAQSADASSMISGRVDGERRGVVGHSWGGLAVFLAAQGHPEIDAVVTLDPNDDAGIAAAAASTVVQPSAHVMAQVMGTCNATNWKDTVFPSTPSPHMRVVVTGAGHCDVEDPTDALCPSFCNAGAGSSVTPYFRRYAVAFMGCVLQSDTAMAPYIGGTSLADDTSAGHLQYVSTNGLDLLPCNGGTLPDAGVIASDAGTPGVDAATSAHDAAIVMSDSGSVSSDSGSPGRDAAVVATSDASTPAAPAAGGCGCRAVRAPLHATTLALAALALALVSRARPRS